MADMPEYLKKLLDACGYSNADDVNKKNVLIRELTEHEKEEYRELEVLAVVGTKKRKEDERLREEHSLKRKLFWLEIDRSYPTDNNCVIENGKLYEVKEG
jgi:hypothetical protein